MVNFSAISLHFKVTICGYCTQFQVFSFYHECRTCFGSNSEANPWWAVDIGINLQIDYVDITNRGDCCRKIFFLLE